MNLTEYNVFEIVKPQGICKFGKPVSVIDEGSFYRIDSTHIIDKFRIQSMELDVNKLTIHLIDEDIVLTVEQRKHK